MVTLQMPSRSNITDIHAPSDRLANLGDRHASWEATRTTAAANGQPGDALYDTDEEDPEVQHLKEVKLVENAPKAKYVKRMTERRKLRNKEFGAW